MRMNNLTKIPQQYGLRVSHINNFDIKLDGGTKMGNIVIVLVPLNSLNIFGYQKVHFMMFQVLFKNFNLNCTCIVS